ncbi:YuzB family protein [Metabacillus malikii]|uniref:Uncharacterized protein YuzB (UPF0349 family) n=1 Tax=Metabacillus malikii TaxID=1504265 RepID=A0ABT9ZBU6_9BACI|nr:YuzB family protein [Metabacillus malikii]MDQ0229735.1 uncharacterized protein YuzB (UPF0349 family) [Metabacillus malikii]
MKSMIEFCRNNLANGAHAALEELKKDPNLDVIEYGCLSYCGKCRYSLYALVDGKLIIGETHQQLVANIYQHLEEHPLL